MDVCTEIHCSQRARPKFETCKSSEQQKAHFCLTVNVLGRLMLVTEMIANCSHNHTKHISRLYIVWEKFIFFYYCNGWCMFVDGWMDGWVGGWMDGWMALKFQELIISLMICSCFVSFVPDYFRSRRRTDAPTMEKTSAVLPIL